MSGEVIEFRRARPRQQAALKVTAQSLMPSAGQRRSEWTKTLAQVWANPRNWRRSRKDNAYIVIDDLNICVVVVREEHGYQWEIRWSDGEETTVSRWTYVSEQIAIDEAWDAVLVLT